MDDTVVNPQNTLMIYLDWAATALPDPDIMRAMTDNATKYSGNPSSPYPAGKAAKAALDDARSRSAAVLGCEAEQLEHPSVTKPPATVINMLSPIVG